MKCKLCGCERPEITYDGLIRNGGLGQYTKKNIPVYKCPECQVIWHEKEEMEDIQDYYESKEYRMSLEGSSDEEDFYRLHDKETLDKLLYTGTEIFRHKIVADIGCGAGAFLDFLSGVADTIIAVEPSKEYRNIMDRKGFKTFAYARAVDKEYRGKVDIVTSFDVIEHVEDPVAFLKDVYELLGPGGKGIIGTPTDAPVMRALLGEIYEKKLLFSTQHLWIFNRHNLEMMANMAGFKEVRVRYFQRYGIGNLLGWLKDKGPKSDVSGAFITDALNDVWKRECEQQGLADYIVLYITKPKSLYGEG